MTTSLIEMLPFAKFGHMTRSTTLYNLRNKALFMILWAETILF